MDRGELTAVLIAAFAAALAFGISRFVTRRLARRRAWEAQVAVQAAQSRQVRRANGRRKKS